MSEYPQMWIIVFAAWMVICFMVADYLIN